MRRRDIRSVGDIFKRIFCVEMTFNPENAFFVPSSLHYS